MDLIGVDEFLPSHGILSDITAEICSIGIGKELCKNTLFILCGFSNAEMNNTLLPTIMVHVPAGAATKQMLHYAQEIKSGKSHFLGHNHSIYSITKQKTIAIINGQLNAHKKKIRPTTIKADRNH